MKNLTDMQMITHTTDHAKPPRRNGCTLKTHMQRSQVNAASARLSGTHAQSRCVLAHLRDFAHSADGCEELLVERGATERALFLRM